MRLLLMFHAAKSTTPSMTKVVQVEDDAPATAIIAIAQSRFPSLSNLPSSTLVVRSPTTSYDPLPHDTQISSLGVREGDTLHVGTDDAVCAGIYEATWRAKVEEGSAPLLEGFLVKSSGKARHKGFDVRTFRLYPDKLEYYAGGNKKPLVLKGVIWLASVTAIVYPSKLSSPSVVRTLNGFDLETESGRTYTLYALGTTTSTSSAESPSPSAWKSDPKIEARARASSAKWRSTIGNAWRAHPTVLARASVVPPPPLPPPPSAPIKPVFEPPPLPIAHPEGIPPLVSDPAAKVLAALEVPLPRSLGTSVWIVSTSSSPSSLSVFPFSLKPPQQPQQQGQEVDFEKYTHVVDLDSVELPESSTVSTPFKRSVRSSTGSAGKRGLGSISMLFRASIRSDAVLSVSGTSCQLGLWKLCSGARPKLLHTTKVVVSGGGSLGVSLLDPSSRLLFVSSGKAVMAYTQGSLSLVLTIPVGTSSPVAGIVPGISPGSFWSVETGTGILHVWEVLRVSSRRYIYQTVQKLEGGSTSSGFAPGTRDYLRVLPGSLLLTAAKDGTLGLWDMAGTRPVGSVGSVSGVVHAMDVYLTRDGSGTRVAYVIVGTGGIRGRAITGFRLVLPDSVDDVVGFDEPFFVVSNLGTNISQLRAVPLPDGDDSAPLIVTQVRSDLVVLDPLSGGKLCVSPGLLEGSDVGARELGEAIPGFGSIFRVSKSYPGALVVWAGSGPKVVLSVCRALVDPHRMLSGFLETAEVEYHDAVKRVKGDREAYRGVVERQRNDNELFQRALTKAL